MTKDIEIDLETIINAKRELLTQRRDKMPFPAVVALAEMQKRARNILNIVTDAGEIDIIGQITYTQTYDPVTAALRYARSGVSGMALFTDERVYTHGMDDLLLVSRGVRFSPVICQDYLLSEYHVTEARAAGASALVLYSSILDRPDLRRVVSLTQRWHMTSIVQVSTESEVEYVRQLSPHVIAVGLDQRFDTIRDMPLIDSLRLHLPHNTKLMPLGCVSRMADARALVDRGVNAIIVDETLLNEPAFNDLLEQKHTDF